MTESKYPEERRLLEIYSDCLDLASELGIEIELGPKAFEVLQGEKKRPLSVPNLDELQSFLSGVRMGREGSKAE